MYNDSNETGLHYVTHHFTRYNCITEVKLPVISMNSNLMRDKFMDKQAALMTTWCNNSTSHLERQCK